MRKPVAVLITVLVLVLFCVLLFANADRLKGLISPRSLLKYAMPMLHGVDVPDTSSIPDQEDGDTEQDEQEQESQQIRFELMETDEGVSDKIRIELMRTGSSKRIDLSGDQPKVLIYQTHTAEAYTPTEKFAYVASDEWRTKNNERNIVTVGELLAKELQDTYGIAVIHDTTDHEPPSLRTSYTRSLETMEAYLEKYPSIELFIDVHRDSGRTDNAVEINGEKVARMMFVVGTGEGQTGAGFSKRPNYKENYALALAVSEKLKEINANLIKPIRVKTSRYNQHIPGRALLVEVGHNANTLEEALAAVPYFAQAIAASAGIG